MSPKRSDEEEEKDSGVRKIALIGGMSKEYSLVYVDGSPSILPRLEKFRVGESVLVDPKRGFFEKVLEDIELPCHELIVTEVVDRSTVRSSVNGQRVILTKDKALALEPGDHIAVDLKIPVILKKLPKPVDKKVDKIPEVHWDDILGQDEAVTSLKEITNGFLHETIAEFYGRKQTKGVLLYGPPGCGKTLLAKAVATGLKSNGFFSLNGPEILSKWVGDSEKGARDFFAKGTSYFKSTGKQAVLFIDEADALLSKRGDAHHSIITHTLIPQFLSLMDGLISNSSILILATNRPDQLDDAITRPGRIDKKIQVKRPSGETAIQILSHYFSKKPCDNPPAELSCQALEYLTKAKLAIITPDITLNASHYLSGALCELLVEESATNAYRRNIMDSSSIRGITPEDVHLAAKSTSISLLHLNHDQIIQEHGLRA